ncbi:4-oxalomesaconate tautomerase [Roseobacter sp. HKCCD9010]|uniref:4-oxalomesaconate tautomerase n=1 Tax=unclassified Roseobacter TaxID=196798 RepID=UPI001491FF7C|nr:MULTISPECIES: 4-oxalomesaconate tautomerase [unclassified Roseobacter]MBF9052133.1 4-oxalomesaconate tautomerase [Rhodobacterales bacterium HKCCD4356]NNV14053.1 4-oxalomesaconate tautomerase [Roseobacter sp. HKCCD7357]NNV18273.1 4-oxalomesaconate tautomerase [Roseobacter sp. HKCCD8768]NNV27752.1 4-oxalomesaconate tautomerase [Roseobacter sp. HKCCD8192]NNV32027.1 4-oxalomesaconate tautomerase [Roseobacter sp. HKCCD9061]
MTQSAIPFWFLRGGTSRGPYFRRDDLPEDRDTLAAVLLAALGSGHPLNIDGIGGGDAVTTKVAMLSRSDDPSTDIDYFFAQVGVEDRRVDFKPTCGNILSGVGPAAIEMGLISATGPITRVRIRAVNTGARIEALVETPESKVRYDGTAQIDGVPGSAAAVTLQFMDTVGGVTGALLPTGNLIDEFDGIPLTCMDVAMPMVIARAADFGLIGQETVEDLNKNAGFFARMESIRIAAGRAMGMGDITQSVTPKFGLLAPARAGGIIATRYFMPWKTHPALAVTGAQCLAACVLTPGTVAEGLCEVPELSPATITLEHPTGQLEVVVDFQRDGPDTVIRSAGLIRTARLLAKGEVLVPQGLGA